MDILNPFNDLAKDIFRQQPIIIVLFLIFMFILLVFYATRTVSKQNSEDHREKGLLIELVKDSNTMFGNLREAIDSLKSSQDKRSEALVHQINEQKITNSNLNLLNKSFSDYHTSIADTISLFSTQISIRLNGVETSINELKNKPDCNDEILNRLNSLGRDITIINDYLVKKETERLEEL